VVNAWRIFLLWSLLLWSGLQAFAHLGPENRCTAVTSFRYDQQGRLWKKITPQLGTLVYSYNNNNQIS